MPFTRRRFLNRSAAALGSLLAAACDLWPPNTPEEEVSGTATPVTTSSAGGRARASQPAAESSSADLVRVVGGA